MKKQIVTKLAPVLIDACPKCQKDTLRVQIYSDTVDFRGIELDVEGLHMTICDTCGHSFQSQLQIRNNFDKTRSSYAAARDVLRVRDGLLSSEEIVGIREQLGLRQREAAVLFGGGSNAFNKYESGEVLQSVPMDRLLRLARCVGRVSVHLLQAVADGRKLAWANGQDDLLLSGLPPVLHISDGSVTLQLVRPSSIRTIMNVIENTTFAHETILDNSALISGSSGIYFKPSQNVGTPKLIENSI